MRRVTWFALLAAAMAGCMKSKPRDTVLDPTGGTSVASNDKPKPNTTPTPKPSGGGDASGSKFVSTKGNLTVKGGEGGFRAPLIAAGRVVNLAELKDLHLGIFQAMQLDPNEMPPDLTEVKEIVRQNSKTQKLLADEVVILTGSRNKTGIFAYTQWPQRAGKHYVVTRQGVEEMAPADLKKRLEDEGSPVKLSN